MRIAIDHRNFWFWFGGLWFAVGTVFLTVGTTGVEAEADQALIFAAVGGSFAVAGAFILFYALRRRQMLERLERTGVPATATISELRPARIRINGVTQWLARYRYQDGYGGTHAGKQMLSPEEAHAWNVGDQINVRFDGQRPSESAWQRGES